jgi:Tfp pilus assembly protein PilF
MRIRTIIAVLIALVLLIAGTAMWSASTIERDGDPDANVIEDSGSVAGPATETKKGNKVARVLAPFKAFGKLFGHKDKNKLERMTEKDAEKFESVGVARVDDARFVEQKKQLSASAKEHLAAGREFLKAGRLNEAIGELSTAVSMDPKLGEAHSLLGVAYDQKGLRDRAKESYEKAVRAEPEDAQVLNNLGFSLYQSGNYRAAIDRLKRAVKLAPGDERILNNLALALCRIGKFDEAYKHFARATGELTGHLNTASMLERFGRDDDAIKHYEAVRRIDANNTVAARRLADLYHRTGRTAQVSSPATSGSESAEAAITRN